MMMKVVPRVSSPVCGGQNIPLLSRRYYVAGSLGLNAHRPPTGPNPSLSISPLEILALPQLRFAGRVAVVSTEQEEERLADHFLSQKIVGLDCEAKPALFGRRNKTAIVQISSEETCAIWRVFDVRSLPALLAQILASGKITKACQGALQERDTLETDFGAELANLVCLYELAKDLQTTPRSLQGLTGIFCRARLKKELRCSNWEAEALSKAQLDYAATDAYASLMVLKAIRERFSGHKHVPIKNEVPLSNTLSAAAMSRGSSRDGRPTGVGAVGKFSVLGDPSSRTPGQQHGTGDKSEIMESGSGAPAALTRKRDDENLARNCTSTATEQVSRPKLSWDPAALEEQLRTVTAHRRAASRGAPTKTPSPPATVEDPVVLLQLCTSSKR